MPTREELEAIAAGTSEALKAQGSNYVVDEGYPDLAPAKPVPQEWQEQRASFEKSQSAPEASMSVPEEPISKTPEPTYVPPETVSSESNMSPPPQTAPVAPPRAKRAQPKATAGAVNQTPAGRESQPDPAEGQVTDADILGLSTNRKNPQPAPAAGGQAPQADGIEDTRFNASDKTRKIQAGVAEGNNRTLDLLGEKEEILDAKQGQQRDINAARSEQAVKSINDAYGRADAADERYEDSRDKWEAENAELKQKMGNPPFDTVGLVMGLVGALAAANGKPEAGRMLQQGVGNAINTRMNKWRGEIEAGQTNLEGIGKLVNMDRLQRADDEAGAAAIQKAVTAEFDAALDQADREAKTEQEKNAIAMVRNDFRVKLGQGELQRREKAAAAAHRRKVNAALAGAKTQEERDAIANANGDVGRDILKDMLKQNMDQAKVGSELLGQQKTASEIGLNMAKEAREKAKAEGKPYKGFIPGYTFTADLPDGLTNEVGKVAMAKGRVMSGFNRLLQIAEDVKTGKKSSFDANDAAEAEALRNAMVGLQSGMNGLGNPTGHEFDTVKSGLADPQKLFQRADARELLLRAARNTQNGIDAAFNGLSIFADNDPRLAEQQRALAGGAAVKSTRPYRMSDGEVRELSSKEIEALKAQGFGSEVE